MISTRNILQRGSFAEPALATSRPNAAEALFSRLLVVHTDTRVDSSLLEYAALLASFQPDVSVHVIAAPAAGVLQSLGPAIRATFAARGVSDVSPWVLPEPDLDEVFAMIQNLDADLLVLRHPRAFPKGRSLARRLLAETPCSVCYVPERASRRLDRVVVGIGLDAGGLQLLEYTAQLCRKAHTEELFAVHARFRETLASEESAGEQFHQHMILELYRFLASVKLNGALVEPVVEDCARYSQAITWIARERKADAVMVGRSGVAGSTLFSPLREAFDLLWQCEVPLLQILQSRKRIGLPEILRKRLSSNPEPAFN